MEGTLKNKHVYQIVLSILAVAVIGFAIWGSYNFNKRKELRLEVENQYQRAFHELVGYVDGIKTQVDKGVLAGSPAQLATISAEIFRQSTAAKACLGQLPTSTIQLDKTAKFLSQVGDYTYVLSQNSINGEEISTEEYKNLQDISEYAKKLDDSLMEIQNGI